MADLEPGEPVVPRDEVRAAIGARQELGAEMEPQIVDAFVERIERRIDERLNARAPAKSDRDKELALAIVSLVVAIPLLGIAGGTVGLPGIIAVCIAIVLVNLVFHR